MAHAAGKRTRAAARPHAESPERTANLGAGGSFVSLALWRSHQTKAARDTAAGLAGFKAVFGGGNCIWLAGMLGRSARDVPFCRSEGPVGSNSAITRRCPSGREPRREELTICCDPSINQPFTEQGVSPRAFVEILLIDWCHIENDVDREKHNLILRYFDYGDYKRRQRS
jgi:hypothetical protein